MSLIHDKRHMAGVVVLLSLGTTLPANVRLRYYVGSRGKYLNHVMYNDMMAQTIVDLVLLLSRAL